MADSKPAEQFNKAISVGVGRKIRRGKPGTGSINNSEQARETYRAGAGGGDLSGLKYHSQETDCTQKGACPWG